MSRLYVYQKTEKLVRKYGTRDPFELLDAMHVQVRFYFDLHSTKGPKEEQRIVAAHELGHIVLHAEALRNSPLFDTAVYDKRSGTEYEANLFAADLLLRDDDVVEAAGRPEADLGSLCLSLGAAPGLMSFKLRSMYARGLGIPLLTECDSRFLARQ